MGLSAAGRVGILIATGLSFAAFGLISYIVFPKILRVKVEENLVLSPTSQTFKFWKDPPVPIYLSFFLFNVTNSEQILNRNSRPVLSELGPYVFRETRHKVNITWNENGTVSYLNLKRWYFVPELTVGSLKDEIVNLNVPLAAMAYQGSNYEDEFFRQAISEIIANAKGSIFERNKVEDILFDGTDSRLLEIAKLIMPTLEQEKFGWFYEKNGTTDGTYTVFTGEHGMQNYGHVSRFNGVREFTTFKNSCNEIRGSAGDMFPPFQKHRNDRLELFVPDICRMLPLTYLEDTVTQGITTSRYWLNPIAFDNGKDDESNKCYCLKECLPSGGLDVSKCHENSPVITSLPHFLYADSLYRQKVSGMHPEPEKHRFFIDLEPEMGMPVKVAARLQVNIAVRPIADIKPFSNLTDTIFYPMFWFSQTVELDEDLLQKVKLVTQDLPLYATFVCVFFIVLGAILILCASYKAYSLRKGGNWLKVPTYNIDFKATTAKEQEEREVKSTMI